MPREILYEYAIIRVFPKVEREEFINSGLILFSKSERILLVKTQLNCDKFSQYITEIDLEEIVKNLKSFEQIARGEMLAGPIAQLDLAERFRWLTAVRSSCIQTSRPHPGFSYNLEQTFAFIFNEMVL